MPVGTTWKRNAAASVLARSTRTGNSTPRSRTTGSTRAAPCASCATPSIRNPRSCSSHQRCHTGSWSLHVHQLAKQKITARRPRSARSSQRSPSSDCSSNAGNGRPVHSVVAIGRVGRLEELEVAVVLPLGDGVVVVPPLLALELDVRALELGPEHLLGQLIAVERLDRLEQRPG